MTRVIEQVALGRVEGEGGVRIELDDAGRVSSVTVDIYEPPRFFEAFLKGRHFHEPPDLTARICGICPVAYQMSACLAIEDALGVDVDPPLADLRRLLYCGEWIESHVLHIHLLHAPDFLGYPSALAFGADHEAALRRGLELKKIGNHIVERLGGRAIHPVNVRVGGFHRTPTTAELQALLPDLRRARDLAAEVVTWTSELPLPDHQLDPAMELVALWQPDDYAVMGGRLRSTKGLDAGVDHFPAAFEETVVEHSTAKHARRVHSGEPYLVGPLARFALSRQQLAPIALDAADRVGLTAAERNPFRSIVVRAVETLHACDVAVRIVEGYERPERPFVPAEARPGIGHGATEAPRGTLYHRYELDGEGLVVGADIVPPTSQNLATMEHDVAQLVAARVSASDDELRGLVETAIRNYDPCISCATHTITTVIHRHEPH